MSTVNVSAAEKLVRMRERMKESGVDGALVLTDATRCSSCALVADSDLIFVN